MPAQELWLKVDITNGSIDYLLGPVIVDVETIVDVIAEVTLSDGRAWRVRVMTGAALIATVDRWLQAPRTDDVLAFPDLMVVEHAGLEAMSRVGAAMSVERGSLSRRRRRRETPMTIVVTTPTGHVGSHVTRQLIQAGERPRLLVRNASRLADEVRASVDVVELDQGDVAAIVRATEGASALFWVDPPTDDADPIEGFARMGASAAQAVRANRIPRVVFQSSGGAEHRHGFGEIDGLARTEELFDATDASVTHLRCGYFFTNLLMDAGAIHSGTLTTTLPLDLRIPWVDPCDIATVVTGRLLSKAWSGRVTQGVHGPADLSFTEVASILTAALGIPVTATQLTDSEVASQLEQAGLTPAQVEGILGMSRGIRQNRPPADPRTLRTTTPTPLAAWALTTLRPMMG